MKSRELGKKWCKKLDMLGMGSIVNGSKLQFSWFCDSICSLSCLIWSCILFFSCQFFLILNQFWCVLLRTYFAPENIWTYDLVCWLCRYVFCCSYSHNVAPKGKFIAFVSTESETDHPETELKPGIDLLGHVDEIFFETYDRYEPVNEPSLDNCFISTVSSSWMFFWLQCLIIYAFLVCTHLLNSTCQSYDATTHFESTVSDVLNMYTLITGKVRLIFASSGYNFPVEFWTLHFGMVLIGTNS